MIRWISTPFILLKFSQFGLYNLSQIPAEMYNTIIASTGSAQSSKRSVEPSFVPDMTLVVNWNRMKPSVGSSYVSWFAYLKHCTINRSPSPRFFLKQNSFQLIFTANLENGKTYCLMSYDNTSNWNSQNATALIGYTDGASQFVSPYSNTPSFHSELNPFSIITGK